MNARFILPVLLLLLSPHHFPQGKIIILSPRISYEIDKDEAENYGLFAEIQNFASATVRQNDTSYFAIAKVSIGTGTRDTIIQLSSTTVYRMAEQIENIADIRMNKYRWGTKVPKLCYWDGSPFRENKNDKAAWYIDPVTKDTSSRRAFWRGDTLPYMMNKERIKFEQTVYWGMGFGLAVFPWNVTGEEEFKQKLGISHLNAEKSVGAQPTLEAFLCIKQVYIAAECVLGSDRLYHRSGLGVSYLLKNLINEYFTPFAGISFSYLEFNRHYTSGDSITVPGTSFKNVLEGVDIKNKTYCYNVLAGMLLNVKPVQLSVSGGCSFANKKSRDGNVETFGIDLSGWYYEIKAMIAFGGY